MDHLPLPIAMYFGQLVRAKQDPDSFDWWGVILDPGEIDEQRLLVPFEGEGNFTSIEEASIEEASTEFLWAFWSTSRSETITQYEKATKKQLKDSPSRIPISAIIEIEIIRD